MANYRKIYEQHYGPIPKGYHVHHKDFNHRNDDPLNLEALDKDTHAQKHGFFNNFIMAQAKACELARSRSRIVHKGNRYNDGKKHPLEQNQAHSKFMMGNQHAKGSRRSEEEKKANSKRMMGNQHVKGKQWKQKETQTIACPYCVRVGGARGMKRWHFKNCLRSPNS